jgi:ArsR family transcriptional regulator
MADHRKQTMNVRRDATRQAPAREPTKREVAKREPTKRDAAKRELTKRDAAKREAARRDVARRDVEGAADAFDPRPFDARPVEGLEADRELALVGKALGHVARVHILRVLRRKESGATVAELVEALGLAQSTVSEHLRVLREAELVVADPESRKGAQHLDIHRLRRLKALVGSL